MKLRIIFGLFLLLPFTMQANNKKICDRLLDATPDFKKEHFVLLGKLFDVQQRIFDAQEQYFKAQLGGDNAKISELHLLLISLYEEHYKLFSSVDDKTRQYLWAIGADLEIVLARKGSAICKAFIEELHNKLDRKKE